MTFLVVANFKSNLTLAEVKNWLNVVKPLPGSLIAPSFPHLPLAVSSWPLAVCAQDVSPFPPGSYTGAVNAVELKELGITYCIVGHSERRRYFHETHVDVANKVRELVAVGITPIVCLDLDDITPQFGVLDSELLAKCYYCFEPASDIGGTSTASSEVINQAHHLVDQFLHDARFMYGGSVNAANIATLLQLNLSGVLVATASLDPASFTTITNQIS